MLLEDESAGFANGRQPFFVFVIFYDALYGGERDFEVMQIDGDEAIRWEIIGGIRASCIDRQGEAEEAVRQFFGPVVGG